MANIVAIVGRPNVGKSTLFNRLIGQKKAIMDDESGVTRDRHYGVGDWSGKEFVVIDTGGYVHGSEDTFEGAIRDQVKIAMEEANIILFMVDCHTGLTGLDKDFAKIVRQTKKPVFIVANKADTGEHVANAVEFYELGLGEMYPVSSASGSGTGELLDDLVKELTDDDAEDNDGVPRIAVLGRPNAGKSSFVNALLGEERNIVTDIAGTTRDSIDTRYNLFEKDFILSDTAGLRKRSSIKGNIEFYSTLRAIKSLEESDVCIVVVDAERGIEAQDINIISLAVRQKKGVLIMVNKWDLIEKDSNTINSFQEGIDEKLGDMSYIPTVFSSVLNKQRIMKVIEQAMEICENMKTKVSTSKLNDIMLKEIEKTPPPAYRGKYIRIKYATQLPTKTPTFAFFCNYPTHIKESYTRYVENKLRSHFNFDGIPINIYFRKK